MNNFKDKSIIVTGAAGFIGAQLIKRLVSEGAEVHAVVRLSTNKERIKDIEDHITVHQLDIIDTKKLKKLVSKIRPVGVFHLAGISQTFWHQPTISELISINIEATIKFMDIMSDFSYDFFVNSGSFVEVGQKNRPTREDDLCEPTEFYSISRLPATLYAQALGLSKEKPMATIRVFTPYGPWVQKGKFPYEVITKALVGNEIRLSDPSVTRDFIYIDDLVDLYINVALRASDNKGQIFNGGSGKVTSLGEFIELVLEYSNSDSSVKKIGQIATYDLSLWQADMSKVSKLLSWQPHHSLEDGIKKTVDWFNKNKNYWHEKK